MKLGERDRVAWPAIVPGKHRQAIRPRRQLRRWLARSGLASPNLWPVCFFLTALASVLLASTEAARAADLTIGPGTVTSTVTFTGPGTLTFAPGTSVVTNNQAGINISGSGMLSLNPGDVRHSISTTGSNAAGILISSGNHNPFLLNDLDITTSGPAGSDGIRVQNPNNNITATGLTVAATGAATALNIIANNNTASFTGSTLTSAAGPVINLAGANDIITLTNTTVTAGSDGRWLAASGSPDIINAIGSTLTGTAITSSGTSNLNLSNGTVWDMTGSSNVTSLTNNASTINFSAPTGDPALLSSYKTLTVNNYTGANGVIGLNTFLGTDGSPSDRLVINGGTATGSTNLQITNTTGPGAYTTANGILVVQAVNGGTTAGSAFTLAGEVRAGFHDYRLYQGGFNGSSPNDWFLRSTFNGGNGNGNGNGGGNGGNGNAGNGPVTPPNELPPEPAPDNGVPPPPGIWPIIGPEIATYGVVQPIARQMGLTTLGTLHERVGDAAADAACLSATFNSVAITKAPPAPVSNCRPAVWGRLFGQQINNHYQAFADPRATGQVAGIQTGIDVWRGSFIPGHTDTAGLYFAYGNGNVSVDGLVTNAAATAYILQHTGSLNLNAFSFGGYWTHYGPSGWYIDAVLQGSFYQGDASTQFARLPTNGTGFTSSLEAGYPIPLPWFGPRFVLEPEGQIIWQRVSFDDANDGLGPVALGTTSGASGRLGLRGKWTINDPEGRVWQPYVLANVWRDWGANANTMFGTESVPLLEQATRLEFAGGLSAKILPGLSLYGQAGYQFAVNGTDGGRRDGVKGNFGVHYAW